MGSLKAATNALLRLEEHRRQILLISRQHVERKLAGALDHAVAGAASLHRHHHQRWLKRALGHPTRP